jgi:hypothetical protein
VAEGGGLLNRYTIEKSYRGFESLSLLHLKNPTPKGWDFLFAMNGFRTQSRVRRDYKIGAVLGGESKVPSPPVFYLRPVVYR